MGSVRRLAVLFLAAAAVARTVSAQDVPAEPQLANWPAPVLWSLAEKWAKEVPETLEGAEPLSVAGVPTPTLPFVAITPCRVADTRGNGFAGQYGPPAITPSGRTITIVGQCSIPASAQAVSFNFTAANISAAGFLVAYPAGGPFPPVATLVYNQNTPNLSNAAVVPLGTGGAITVVAGVTTVDVIIDVNGYYGPDLDSICVNEGQASSVTSSMIVDGTIVNADINASAAIADTKLATITTAGKVADSALSANVSKLGQTIEAIEIANINRTISIPLSTLVDCEASPFAFLKFVSGSDTRADFDATGPGAGGDGVGFNIVFDTSPGLADQNTEICSQLAVPPDYVAGGHFRVLAKKPSDSGASENLNCAVAKDLGAMEIAGVVGIVGTAAAHLNCFPTLPSGLTAGDTLRFYLSITSSGTMDDAVRLYSVAFEYAAAQ